MMSVAVGGRKEEREAQDEVAAYGRRSHGEQDVTGTRRKWPSSSGTMRLWGRSPSAVGAESVKENNEEGPASLRAQPEKEFATIKYG